MLSQKPQSWATEVDQIPFLSFLVCSPVCELGGEWIYYLFSLKISFWWEILGIHQGWISAHPSTLRWCKLNRPGWGPSSCFSPSLLLVKGKIIMFILTADSVQMCFLNGTCDTFIYPLWRLEPLLFTSFPAVQGKSVGNLLFVQTDSLTLNCLFCFLSNLNHTSSPWEKGYSIKGKLFRTPPMRSSQSSPFGRNKGGGLRKNEIFLIPVFLRTVQGMPERWKETKIYPPFYLCQRMSLVHKGEILMVQR